MDQIQTSKNSHPAPARGWAGVGAMVPPPGPLAVNQPRTFSFSSSLPSVAVLPRLMPGLF
jgi:hypothetical protein